ncbi:hypothetical protein GGR56DRAFT_113150 [Xylariaceae sp. FL0804]|nr:hypothetical protein GGR56DRAFT_113150 [Xylariaceae sp. FL0804]
MSRSTPRKSQKAGGGGSSTQSSTGIPQILSPTTIASGHLRTRSQQIQAQEAQQQFLGSSDYESDTAAYMASHPSKSPAALAARTNTELNMSVLKRYVPGITGIISIAANAVLYVLQPPGEWKKSNLEGTMFICSQDGTKQGVVSEKGCLFILNRKGLQNFTLDLNNVSDFELSGDLLIFKMDDEAQAVDLPMESGEAPVKAGVVGLWTYAEVESDRQANAAVIYEMWAKVREARERRAAAAVSTDPAAAAEDGPAAPATAQATGQVEGRKLSLSELFKGQHGIAGGGV